MYRLSIMLYKNYIIQDNLKKSRSRHSSLIYRNPLSLAQYILSRKPEGQSELHLWIQQVCLPPCFCAKYYDSQVQKQESSWIK